MSPRFEKHLLSPESVCSFFCLELLCMISGRNFKCLVTFHFSALTKCDWHLGNHSGGDNKCAKSRWRALGVVLCTFIWTLLSLGPLLCPQKSLAINSEVLLIFMRLNGWQKKRCSEFGNLNVFCSSSCLGIHGTKAEMYTFPCYILASM